MVPASWGVTLVSPLPSGVGWTCDSLLMAGTQQRDGWPLGAEFSLSSRLLAALHELLHWALPWGEASLAVNGGMRGARGPEPEGPAELHPNSSPAGAQRQEVCAP